MATVNKKDAVSQATGLPTKEQLLTMPENRDTVPAVVQNQDGTQGAAMVSEGEIVFSLPAIIALGEGDYDTGAEMLLELHDQLKMRGEKMMQQNSLAGYPTDLNQPV